MGAGSQAEDFQGASHLLNFEQDPIRYSASESHTAVDRLGVRLASSEGKVVDSVVHGYLPALLEALDIPVSSQVLVFAKSSAQRSHIRPQNPRAIYFNDDVYVGYIPGAPVLELTASDPTLGTVFYTAPRTGDAPFTFERTSQCLECHAASRTMGIPGHLFRSFAIDAGGFVDFTEHGAQMTHRLPLNERYGGWYLTGKSAPRTGHLGVLIDPETPPFEAVSYPRSTSDILPLLVLGHQVHFHNYATRLNYEARMAVWQYGHLRYLRQQIEGFLRYVLFVDEVPLPNPVAGDPEFRASFSQRALRDAQGRSLRDFDLERRLFRYPCSYLIYSQVFTNLESQLRTRICQRLDEILSAPVGSDAFGSLTTEDRKAIREILLETHPLVRLVWESR